MFEIGILQGRLSSSHDGRFQFFPVDWQTEFALAKELGFTAIEWLVDWPDWQTNPILDHQGRGNIGQVIKASGVAVSSVCADYFMKHKLIGSETKESVAMLVRLLDAATHTRERLVLVPILEQNVLKSEAEKIEFIQNFQPALLAAEKLQVRIGFETEMPAAELAQFVDQFDSKWVGAYYDIGNCTSYGADCPAELRYLNKRVFGVHVKDRKKGSAQSVLLGTGDADFPGCISALADIGYSGVLIAQAWRGEDHLQDARVQLAFMQEQLPQYQRGERT